jgi:hypothetical protein
MNYIYNINTMSKKVHILVIFMLVLAFGAGRVMAQAKKSTKGKSTGLHTRDLKSKKKNEIEYTNLQVGAGMMGSVLYLSRNVKESNDAKGYTIVANYGGHKLLRFSAQYTHYVPINIAPTWYTIKANTIEANMEIMARFSNDKTFLYPFLGLSYNEFKGFYTGFNDYLNLREKYRPNTNIVSKWVGLNIGTGLEHSFNMLVVFADYRMRVGKQEEGGVNIMDVCYSAGLRLKLFVPKFKHTKIFRGLRDKYHWF